MTKIQPMPRRRRQLTAAPQTATTPTPPSPTLSPPPITQGVDAVVEWFGRLNLHLLGDAAPTGHKLKTLQTVLSSFSRVRSPARDVEMILKARQQREGVSYALAYADEAPVTDAQALPLWHAMEIARLAQLVLASSLVDAEDYRNVSARLKHHVAGVQVREVAETTAFKRRHKIGADVAGAVEGYAQIQQQLEQEQLTEADAVDARDDLVAFGKFMQSDFEAPWHIQVIADALMRVERREVKGLILNVPPRHGKPVWEEEIVQRADGSRCALKEIKVGDVILSGSGVPRVVEEVFVQGDLPCVEIETRYGRVLRMALDHPVMTTGGWKEAGKIGVGDIVAVTHAHELPGKEVFTDADFALAGYLLGDGSVNVTAKGDTCGASFTNADPEIIADFTRVAGQLGFKVRHIDKYSYGLSCASGRDGYTPRHWIRERGVMGSSYTKQVPAWVFTAPLRQIAIYLGTYFACDGSAESLGKNGYRLTYNSVSWEILEAVQHLLLRFGIHSSLRLKNGTYKGRNHVSFRTTIYGEHNIALFRKHIPVTGKRGHLLQASTPRFCEFPVKWFGDEVQKVSQIGKLACRCLTVAVDHTFTVRDVVVHNTNLASILFASWYLGRHPSHDVIVGSLSSEFAENNIGGPVRNLIQSPEYRRVFPGVNVSQDTAAKGAFRIFNEQMSVRQRRGMFAALGRTAAPTGKGASLLLLDDLLSEQDAYNATERAHLFDQIYRFRSRLAPNAVWVVINTRYHEDDVVGVVKKRYAADRKWEVVTLPVYAEQHESWPVTRPATANHPAEVKVFHREPGEILWPLRRQDVEAQKALLAAESPQIWSGQFMCKPVAQSGAMIDINWFRRYDYEEVAALAAKAVRIVVSIDTGGVRMKHISSSAARTAITVWAEMDDGRCYLVDILADPWIYPDIIKYTKAMCNRWKPTDLLIEDKAAGTELIVDLAEQRDWVRTPVTAIMPHGPKETRMGVASPQIRSGQIYVPATGICEGVPVVNCPAPAWVEGFLNEMMHFPLSSRKDQVDSTSQMLNWRRENPVQGSGFSTDMSTGARRDVEAALRGPWGARGGNSGGSGVRRIGW